MFCPVQPKRKLHEMSIMRTKIGGSILELFWRQNTDDGLPHDRGCHKCFSSKKEEENNGRCFDECIDNWITETLNKTSTHGKWYPLDSLLELMR